MTRKRFLILGFLAFSLIYIACESEPSPPSSLVLANDGSVSSRRKQFDSSIYTNQNDAGDSETTVDAVSSSLPEADLDSGNQSNTPAEDAANNTDQEGPNVEIISPEPASDPDEDTILTEAPVMVQCRVTRSDSPSAADVDPSSIRIALIIDGEVVEDKETVSDSSVFQAEFSQLEIGSGAIAFRCSASDTFNPPRSSSHTIDTFFDSGPIVEPIAPIKETSHPLAGSLSIEFKVSANRMNKSDTESEVSEILLKVAGIDIDVQEVESEPGLYRTFIDFSDATVFPDPPSGMTPIIIYASNSRTPEKAETFFNYSIIVDGQGPNITINRPADGAIVGGEVVLEFMVDDENAGVDPDTVVAEINTSSNPYDPLGQWSIVDNLYTFRFDTRNIQESEVQININIDAKDWVGNPAPGASLVLYLDNRPPVVELDPPHVRESEVRWVDNVQVPFCSYIFDPVGPSAVNDLDVVPNMVLFRAVVWDLTNFVSGQKILFYSTVDPSTVDIFLQDDVTKPLLIDTDGDGYCDELDYEDLPYQEMNPIIPEGLSYYGPAEFGDFNAEPPPYASVPDIGDCQYFGTDSPPKPLCTDEVSDMTRVIAHTITGGQEPAIYAMNVEEDSLQCTGGQWELTPLIEEGWACVAVRALDYVGNVGVSKPLRICFDDPTTDNEPCADPPEATCTDGCTLDITIENEHIFDYPLNKPI